MFIGDLFRILRKLITGKVKIEDEQPKNYFALQFSLYKIMGLDFPNNSKSKIFKVYSKFILCIIFGYPFFQGCDIFRFYNAPEVFNIICLYNTVYWTCAAKVFILLYTKKSVYRTLTSIEKGIFAPQSEYETKLIKRFIRLANIMSILYITPATTSMSTAVIDAFTVRFTIDDPSQWVFPMGGFGAFNVSYTPNYDIALIIQSSCSVICVTSTLYCDVLIASSLVHLTAQFKLLQHRIRNMLGKAVSLMNQGKPLHPDKKNGVVEPSEIPWEHLKTVLNECTIYHMEILDFTEKLENAFTYLYMLQFLISSITICFTLYCCSLFPVTDMRFVHYMQGTVALTAQVFYSCYFGNEATLNGIAIADACWDVDFPGTDIRFQKGLILIVARSQRQVSLTAGKFAQLSLNTFVAVMRASYSYYTVLASR